MSSGLARLNHRDLIIIQEHRSSISVSGTFFCALHVPKSRSSATPLSTTKNKIKKQVSLQRSSADTVFETQQNEVVLAQIHQEYASASQSHTEENLGAMPTDEDEFSHGNFVTPKGTSELPSVNARDRDWSSEGTHRCVATQRARAQKKFRVVVVQVRSACLQYRYNHIAN